MDKFLQAVITTVWGRSLLFSILGLLASAVVWLALELQKVNEKRVLEQEAARRQYIQALVDCANEIDRKNREHLEFVTDALRKLEKQKRR